MRLSRFPMWAVMTAGCLTFGKAFAALGVPPLYIGEAYLGFKVLQNPRNWVSRFVNDCLRGRILPLAIALHLGWGIFEVGRSWFMGRDLIETMRTAAFNYYPLFILLGIEAGLMLTMQQFVRLVKFMVIVYAVRAAIQPIDNFEWWGEQASLAMTPILMIALWSHLRDWKWKYPLFALNTYLIFFAGTHGRGSMLSFIAGLVALTVGSRERLLRWGAIGMAVTLLLIFVGPYIPGPTGGGPPLDPFVQVARVIASDYPDAAIHLIKWREHGKATGSYADEVDNLINARGTASWRQGIWTNAMNTLTTPTLLALGQGEAMSLYGLTPDGQDIHTPHNISIYCIYYTGWIGLIIFFGLLLALWITGQQIHSMELRTLFSAILWCVLLTAITGNFLETPFGAVPSYLLLGVVLGMDRRQVALTKQTARLASASRSEESFTASPAHRPFAAV